VWGVVCWLQAPSFACAARLLCAFVFSVIMSLLFMWLSQAVSNAVRVRRLLCVCAGLADGSAHLRSPFHIVGGDSQVLGLAQGDGVIVRARLGAV